MAAAMFSIYHKAWAAADGTCYSPIDLYSAANQHPPNTLLLSQLLSHWTDDLVDFDGYTIVRLYSDLLSNAQPLNLSYAQQTAQAYSLWKHE